MATTSRGGPSPIKTQDSALSFNDMRNWSRLTRGQPLQLSGIDFGVITQLQEQHKEFINITAMSRDECNDFENDRGSTFATELLDSADSWATRCSDELGPQLNTVMAAACEQIAPGVLKDVEMSWREWMDDEDTSQTLHPYTGRTVWVPHFALPLSAVVIPTGEHLHTWVYFSYHVTPGGAYSPRPPMYTWPAEDVVVVCVCELFRKAIANGYLARERLALAWRSQLDIQPAAYP